MNPLFLTIPIFLPILGGLAMLVHPIRREMSLRVYCEAVACVTAVCVLIAVFLVRHDPVTIYSFTRGFTVTFRVDGMAALFAVMVSIMWPLVLLYAYEYMEHETKKNSFFAFYIMTYGVTLGVCFAADMITMYLFFEMLTLVTIPLVAYYGNHDSMFAGRKYAAYTIGGASLGLMAVVLTSLYGEAGMFQYGGSFSGHYDTGIMYLAFLMGFVGFGAKAAVFPLHDWLPTAGVAPTPVTALLHAVAVVNSGVFAVLRMTYYVYGIEFLHGTPVQAFCLFLSLFSLLFGAAQALKERHFKRRLAYSTMSNLSYMLLGAMTVSPMGLTAALAHMLFHGIVKITLFMCAGAFMHRTHRAYIYELNGVGHKMPFTFTTYTLGALSLTGIPLFCGFVSKWQLLHSCMSAASSFVKGMQSGSEPVTTITQVITAGLIAGAGALIMAAFLCAIYSLSVSVRAFFPIEGKDLYEDSSVTDVGILMKIPLVAFTAANLFFGIHPGPILAFLTQIGNGLL